MSILRRALMVLSIGLFMSLAPAAQAQEQASPSLSQADLENIPVALEQYDAVTYFDPSGPLKGNETYQATYDKKRYFFVSIENREKFTANPEQYLPEFGEYCACAVSKNKTVKADPKVFKITEGKLVLFEDEKALSLWQENEEERYKKAQDFWKYESKYDAGKRLREDSRLRLGTF